MTLTLWFLVCLILRFPKQNKDNNRINIWNAKIVGWLEKEKKKREIKLFVVLLGQWYAKMFGNKQKGIINLLEERF